MAEQHTAEAPLESTSVQVGAIQPWKATTSQRLLHTSVSGYGLDLFTSDEVSRLQLTTRDGRDYVRCEITDKDRPAKPEEIVRQLFLRRLIHDYGYPKSRIFLERGVYFGSRIAEKRADIIVVDERDPNTAYIIVELKNPRRRDGIEQLQSYCNAEGSPIGIWTNGRECVSLHRGEPNLFKNLPNIPHATQRLADLLSERWDLDRLQSENRLVRGTVDPEIYNSRHGRSPSC